MSVVDYPKIQRGSFDAGSTVNICLERGVLNYDPRRADITASCNGVAAAVKKFAHGIAIDEFVGMGHLELEADSTISLGQASTLTPGVVMHAQTAVLRMVWPLFNVTGSGMTYSEWDYGIPTLMVSVNGIAIADAGDDWTTNSVTTTVVIDDVGSLTGTAKLGGKSLQMLYQSGGPIPLSFTAAYSGGATLTPTGTNYTWLLPSGAGLANTGAPTRGTVVLDIDTSTNITRPALLYDVTIRPNMRDGNRVPVECRFRFDGPAA